MKISRLANSIHSFDHTLLPVIPMIQSHLRTYRIIAACVLGMVPGIALADWTTMETGIQDNLTGVVFVNQYGILSGERGLYYTLTGGQGANTWTRFDITGNQQDQDLYNRCRFNHLNAFIPQTDGYVYACGEDTVQHVAIILRIHIPSLDYSFLYKGPDNSSLNHVTFHPGNGDVYAVGKNGLIVTVKGQEASLIPFGLQQDLLSMTIQSNDAYFIGADGYQIWGDQLDNFNPSFYPTQHQITDLSFGSGSSFYAAGDKLYSGFNKILAKAITYFDFGPLNASDLLDEKQYLFVATDHGIFRSPDNSTPASLEWQPSSGKFRYSELWGDPSTTNVYAAGAHGRLMMTSDLGGKSQPYVVIKFLPGACLKEYQQFQLQEKGTATTCKWYVNGQLIKNSCSAFIENFDTVGLYHLELQTTNGSFGDTVFQDFYIVEKPDINLSYVIDDTTLCKDQAIEISLSSTQPEVYYLLLKENGSTDLFFGNSTEGSSGSVTFTSASISEKGIYFLQSSSSIADCKVDFSEPLPLIIENTRSDFRPALWNVKPGEEVFFYQTATDANEFEWYFSASSSISHSTLPDLTTQFNETGSGDIKLIVTSPFGCIDSITKPGPTMYIPLSTPDPCWINHQRETDLPWQGHYDPDISELEASRSGYFTCGQFSEVTFPTQHGDSIQVPGKGCYLAKYDFDGTIKWYIYTRRVDILVGYDDPEYFFTVEEDKDENVYASGLVNGYGSPLVDNAGHEYPMGYSHEYFTTKLDKNGKVTWFLNSKSLTVFKIRIDNDGNVMALAKLNGANPSFIRNGIQQDTLEINGSGNFLLLKISPEGYVIWHTTISLYALNFSRLTELGIDQDNNIYITGGCENAARFYSIGNPVPNDINNFPDLGTMLFLVKYNTDGQYQWGIRGNTIDSGKRAFPLSMQTDDAGNSYIGGRNSCKVNGCQFLIENTDLTNITTSGGEYFIAKINKNGICEWIQTAAYSFYGFGFGVSLHENEISVSGELSDQLNNNDIQTVHFTSQTGPGIDMTIREGNYFIAVYDTLGTLLRIHVSGFNAIDQYVDLNTYPGFFQIDDGSYYIGRNVSMEPGPFTIFNEQVRTTLENDGYVAHFDPSCAATYYPGLHRVDTVYVCAGSLYVFPNGEEQVIKQSIAHTSLFSAGGQDSAIITFIKITEPLDISLHMIDDTISVGEQDATYQWLKCDQGYEIIPDATAQAFNPSGTGYYAVVISGQTCVDTSECVHYILTADQHTDGLDQILYYPNPSSGIVHISLGEIQEQLTWTILSITGHVIERFDDTNVRDLNIQLPEEPGIYLIQLTLKNGYSKVVRIVRT